MSFRSKSVLENKGILDIDNLLTLNSICTTYI